MDQPNAPSPHTAAPAPAPAHRDMMFCHECQDEWFRDEHGLTCPECGSDFTEIIEEGHDPRVDPAFGHHHHDDDDDGDSMPSLEEAPHHRHPFHHHNPWRDDDDPDETDISNLQFRQSGPGRFVVTGSIYRTISPTGRGGDQNGPNTIGGFASLLQHIVQGAGPRQGAQDDRGQSPNRGEGVTTGGHRFTYTANARLFPRDADHPGPHMEPVDELNNVLVGLMAAFGEPPGARHHHHDHDHDPDHEHDHGHPRMPPINPLLAILGQMIPGNGRAGDFVYSQEALDRIISQLMEQNATSNAPGPASQQDIDSLPRKPVTEELLGAEGRAECSICMEEVHIGEHVTELPCHHWFHHQCVAAWLGEHDTCPHCRKGITKQADNPTANADTGPGASAGHSSNQMPGSFGVTGEGTTEHPFIVPDTPQRNNQGETSGNQDRPGSSGDGSGGGFGDRIRRGLFGS